MDTVHGLDDERSGSPEAVKAFKRDSSAPGTGAMPENAGTSRDGDDDRDTQDTTDAGISDVMFDLGGDERRMHVRAYNHWVSLLKGRPYPSIANLEPETITDFGPHSVLLDFSRGMGDPKIAYLGRALREECGLKGPIATIADVPSRSLLSRLTDHYLQIIANRAPIGFEAEFVSSRGRTTLYRGILMPFTSGGDTIDFIFGVINWKELADAALQATLYAELDAVCATPEALGEVAQIWADGPSGGFDSAPVSDFVAVDTGDKPVTELMLDDPLPSENVLSGPFEEQLAVARESAVQARAAEKRSQAVLHRTLGRAHDLALSAKRYGDHHGAFLSAACLPEQPDAMTQIVALVFGPVFDAGRLTEFVAVLSHATRHQVPIGGLPSFLNGYDGNLGAIADAERTAL